MKNLLFILLFTSITSLFAAPYNGNIVKFRQPDGTFVDIKLFGDEFYIRAEGLNGYTLIRDMKTGWICYATLSDNANTLMSTGIIYDGTNAIPANLENNADIPMHIDINNDAIEKYRETNRKLTGANKFNFTTDDVNGNIKGICIVVDFSDEPGILPMTEFQNFCNNMTYSNYGNNGSLRTFYSDISGGLLDYENVVFGYYRAPLTFSQYDQMPYAQGAKQILALALNWIDSIGFDFSTLSLNPDNSIMAINLMYTGYPPNWAQGMWYHQGYYPGFSADGVHSGPYNCSPANQPLELAVVAHENGHMIGKWPDTYKYNNNTGPDGIGSFDLMCSYGNSYNPTPPNPYFRSNAGWGQVIDITYFNGLIHDTAGSLSCYKYRNINDTNEFFILENRETVGRSQHIPDNGLTIWHIDCTGDNQTLHHMVYLEHANNDIWNHYDACFHQGFNNEFGINTTPSSTWYNGDPSGLRAWEISAENHIMDYKIGAGTAAPSFNISWVNISGDDNSNGFLEPAENGYLNVNTGNFGQIASASASITCSAQGATASYVTLVNPSQTLGIINTGQTLPAAFQVQVAPNTPLGTQLKFKFEISDGTYSSYINRTIIVGEQVIINNQQIFTCMAMFYDHGGPFANYSNMTDYITTVSPAGNTFKVKVEFLSFDLEDEDNCIYDWLNIYDGFSTTSPLLGTWCGSNSPGTIVSTDPYGALTFSFHSDEGVTGTGWEAILSCDGNINISESRDIEDITISPNPSNGIFTVGTVPGEQANISIITPLGSCIYRSVSNSTGITNLDLTGAAKGIYLLQLSFPDRIVTRKLLIK